MKIYTVFDRIDIRKPVVTIGTFDGIHLGHKLIINKLIEAAKQKGGESTVITFWPHPRQVIQPVDESLKLLSSLEERLDILSSLRVEHALIIPFNKEMAEYSALDFVKKILVEKLNIKHLIIGHDHHFGKNREGGFSQLLEYSELFGFSIEQLSPLMFDEIKISSTKIRNSLKNGNVEFANNLLGYNYLLSGVVVTGDKFGRTIGFPTANLFLSEPNKLLPANGVYAVWVEHNGNLYKGMINIGTRPTVSKKDEITKEVHILDFDKEIYRHNLRVFFVKRIRDEIRFDSVAKLKEQLTKDKEDTKYFLRNSPPPQFLE